MTYNVFGGTLNLAQSINQSADKHSKYSVSMYRITPPPATFVHTSAVHASFCI